MHFINPITVIALSCSVLLSACSQDSASTQSQLQDIPLFQAQPISPVQLGIKSHEQQQLLVNTKEAVLGDGLVSVAAATKDTENDALVFKFKDSWSSGLFLNNAALDLTRYVNSGTLEFDLRIDDIQQGKLDLIMNCEANCTQVYRLREWAQTNEGQGWQHLSIPLECLVDSSADLRAVNQPFTLSTGGKGQMAVANVSIKAKGTANMPCVSAEQLATTPATLNEYWSVNWWLPRHAEKVAQAESGQAQLVMIGDSITHGWENDGKAVWDQYFSDINTLNLGYGGDRTENVLWRLQHGELGKTQPKLVVMMIGTNNTGHRMDSPQAIAAGVNAIVDELITRVPDSPILLLAIFPRDAEPDSAMRLNNQAATQLIAQIAEQRNLLFANFNAGFLTQDGVLTTEIMPDLLHPKSQGYEIWAKQLAPYIDEYVRKKN